MSLRALRYWVVSTRWWPSYVSSELLGWSPVPSQLSTVVNSTSLKKWNMRLYFYFQIPFTFSKLLTTKLGENIREGLSILKPYNTEKHELQHSKREGAKIYPVMLYLFGSHFLRMWNTTRYVSYVRTYNFILSRAILFYLILKAPGVPSWLKVGVDDFVYVSAECNYGGWRPVRGEVRWSEVCQPSVS